MGREEARRIGGRKRTKQAKREKREKRAKQNEMFPFAPASSGDLKREPPMSEGRQFMGLKGGGEVMGGSREERKVDVQSTRRMSIEMSMKWSKE